jgi:class 3 adenylate cyclase/tetratricopeptide (TPR) repeat protein
MRCPACSFENASGIKFCGDCGASLKVRCSSCGFENAPGIKFCGECGKPLAEAAKPGAPPDPRSYTPKQSGARFCDACGHAVAGPANQVTSSSPQSSMPRHLAEKILNSRASLEGERRQITALFVDVVDSTPLAERLGPEETHTLIRRCFDLMLEAVHRYEGTVSQFTGDGILALFGAPIAHEDHPQRAVRAALAIQHAIGQYQRELQAGSGLTFQVRIGINSGPVVVGTIGTDLNMTYAAIGDTVNLAARIQGLAAPGTVVISEATRRLVDGYFISRDLGRQYVKGKEQAIGVHEVLRPSRRRSRLDIYAEQGLSPLVGRQRELQTLTDCYSEAQAGHGQVVFITGDPGIGKSRLLHELKLRLEGEELTWLEGRCISYGRDIAYLPIVDVLKESFGIEELDDEAAIVDKVERSVRAMGGDLAVHLPYLKYLLSADPGDATVVSMDPSLRKTQLFAALQALTTRGTTIRPFVIVFEDLHWSDRLSEEWISYLIDSMAEQRLLLLLTYRAGYEPPFGVRPNYTGLHLDSLSARDSAELAQGMLEVERLPDELQHVIAAKAEGNPFFIEEVLKSLLEAGAIRRDDARYVLAKPIDAIHVPDTVQDVIMARLDRLEEDPKRALQTAAVIGREFTVRLLDRTANLPGALAEHLQKLKTVELIYERTLYPELAFMFKHALTHDVAYNSLLVARRKVLHRLIGLAIEELYADRISEQYEILAHHFTQAEDWDRALDYLLKSAQKATEVFAVREALARYDEALVAADRLGVTAPIPALMRIHAGRSDLLFANAEYPAAREAAAQHLALARRSGNRVAESRALVQGATAAMWMEDFDGALAELQESVTVSEAAGADSLTSAGLHVAGFIQTVRGEIEAGWQKNERALQLSRAAGNLGLEAQILHILSASACWRGRYQESLALADEGLRISREQKLLRPLLLCLWNLGVARPGLGDFGGGLAALDEGLALAEQSGHEGFVGRFVNTLAWLLIDCGDWDRGLQAGWRSLDIARRRKHATGFEAVAFIQANQSVALVATGDLTGAAECLEEALYIVEHPPPSRWMTWRYATHCFASLAELWLARGDFDRTDRFANQSLEIAEPHRARKYESRAWRLKGESALARRRWDDAEQSLREALVIAKSIGEARQLWKVHEALGRLERQQGHMDAARKQYGAGRAVVERVLAQTNEAGLRAGLETMGEVRELLTRTSS